MDSAALCCKYAFNLYVKKTAYFNQKYFFPIKYLNIIKIFFYELILITVYSETFFKINIALDSSLQKYNTMATFNTHYT